MAFAVLAALGSACEQPPPVAEQARPAPAAPDDDAAGERAADVGVPAPAPAPAPATATATGLESKAGPPLAAGLSAGAAPAAGPSAGVAPAAVAEAPRVLKHPVIEADLLYAAKIERPKSPRRRRPSKKSSKPKKKKMTKSADSVPMGALGSVGFGSGGGSAMGAGKGGGGGGGASAAPRPSAHKPQEPRSKAKDKTSGNTRYLSADDSNSQASPVLVRQAINAGRYVDPSLVRTYEFLNYHSFEYAAPTAAEQLAVAATMRKTSEPEEFSLQVALRSADRARAEMKPLHTTIVLDTSGSMAGPSIELARQFVERFAGSARAGDAVSLVVANRDATALLEHSVVDAPEATARELAALLQRPEARPNDVTNLERGIKRAYEIAAKHATDQSASRVMLISDGAANFGRTSKRVIEKHAADADKQGIYLIGVGLGVGFNDMLMNAFTDRGRGAYVFLDSAAEIERVLAGRSFAANFDVSLKDVRLKMVMPDGWSVKSFHGEQISRSKSKVTPQYLAPNDQMIYHMILSAKPGENLAEARFEFEAEFAPIDRPEGAAPLEPAAAGEDAKKSAKKSAKKGAKKGAKDPEPARAHKQFAATAETMLGADARAPTRAAIKGNALVAFAETVKKMKYPLEQHREANLARFDKTRMYVEDAQQYLNDNELADLLTLMTRYRETLEYGERFAGARDQEEASPPDAVLGIPSAYVKSVKIKGARPKKAIKALTRLRDARKLVPQEGYRMLAISSGPVGNAWPAGTGELSQRTYADPQPRFMGNKRSRKPRERVHDLYQVTVELTAPQTAQSFSFDFNYFSAEYPEYIQQDFNDTFYAILRAESTHNGAPTNISFDANSNSIEVDNNYFENQFHPIPNWGTGFDFHGSTGWLRTSWPIRGGETFTLTFSVHDEGDGIFDSLALLDNFAFHDYPAVGTTDPLN